MNLTPTDLQILYAHLGNEITRLRKSKKGKLVDSQARTSEQIKGLETRRGIIEQDLIMIAVGYTDKRLSEISGNMKPAEGSKIEVVKE